MRKLRKFFVLDFYGVELFEPGKQIELELREFKFTSIKTLRRKARKRLKSMGYKENHISEMWLYREDGTVLGPLTL